MATFQELMDGLKQQRERASEKSPMADVLKGAIAGMDVVATAVDKLQQAVRDQTAANLVARKTGEAEDVQQTIRNLLQTKVAEDKIERERHHRMMDMAERLVPQVTEEQIKAIREQQQTFRTFNKALNANLKEIEQKRAEANFAIQDKYGTIESALGGIANSGGDSLGKFLVNGLSRFVKEKKETPAAEAVKEKYDDEVWWMKEASATVAARENISDPGSAAKLYSDRAQQVKSLAVEGETFEKQLLSGRAKFSVPKMEQAVKDVANALRTKKSNDVPVLTKDGVESSADLKKKSQAEDSKTPAEIPTITKADVETAVNETTNAVAEVSKSAEPITPKAEPTAPQATPQPVEARPAPKNAKFERASTQTTRPNGPTPQRTSPQATVNKPVASVGKFGSKAGAVNVGGITKALGGIVGKLGSLAGSALKFLGPWGMVASAIMSFDRLVPIFSSLAGAIMDLTKLIMPLLVSTAIEGFAQILGGFNGLIALFDQSFLGRGWNKDKEVVSKVDEAKKQAEADAAKRAESKRQAAQGGVAVDTTSAGKGASVGQPVLQRRETALTSPAEANAVSEQARASVQPQQSYALADWREQQQQNKAMRESVMAAASNPGTTPVMVANPSLAPWMV